MQKIIEIYMNKLVIKSNKIGTLTVYSLFISYTVKKSNRKNDRKPSAPYPP